MRILLIIVLTITMMGCVNMGMVWEKGKEYRFLETVLVYDGQWYVSYASLADGNIGHDPLTSPDWWGK
jgi:hypothetical protein